MKIAFFSSSKSIIPPLKTGGIEQSCYYLIKELVRRGHRITLFAAPGSKIKGVKIKNISPFPTAIKQPYANLQERIIGFYDQKALADFFYSGEADKFDIIQFNNYLFYQILPFATCSKTQILIEVNYPHKEIYPYIRNGLKQFKNVYYLPVSNFIKKLTHGLPCAEIIYPVFDIKDFTFSNKKGEYLLFIGRICPEKGTHLAIQAALKTKMKLVIAGGVEESHKYYFNKEIRPYIDNDKIIYVGEVDFQTKIKIYKKTIATLFPSLWDEPFGMVQIESMACGTPVISFDKSAAREIIKNGVSGYIVDVEDTEQMARAAIKAAKLDRKKIRQYVENKFSIEKEVDKFERVCKRLLKKKI